MEIIWHGNSCFSLKTKQAVVVTNPYKAEHGSLAPLKADIVIETGNFPGYDNAAIVSGEPQVIDWPGEYEIKGLAITIREIIDEDTQKPLATILMLNDQNLRLCFLEKIGKGLTNTLVESLGQVDVLIIHVGGGEGINAATAHKLIEELEPRSVIPMHYAVDGVGKGCDPLESLKKLVGAGIGEAQDKWNIQNRSQLKEDVMEYIVLKVS